MPAFLTTLDPKLVIAAVTYALTLLVTSVGLDLDSVLVTLNDVDVTVAHAVAAVAAVVAGYFKSNDGTALRTPQESGNADYPVG